MKYNTIRKLQEQSGSFLITLPKIWVEANELKQGNLLKIVFGEENQLKVVIQ